MKIVCLGDSLTTGYNLVPGEGWVDLLNRETPHLWVNAGVAGDTSTRLLVRLQSQALPQKPDMVLFMGGDNDIMLTGSADQAKSAVMAMVHQCVAAGVRPVVGIPYPVRTIPAQWQPVCDMDRALEASAEYVRWLRRLTDAISLRRVDFGAAFDVAGNTADLYQRDGMHPSRLGSRVMADAVLHDLHLVR